MQNIDELQQESSERKPFIIDSDEKANWAFRNLAKSRAKKRAKELLKDKYDRQNQEWYDKQVAPIEDSINYFESAIEQYRQTLPDGKINVPAGSTEVRHLKKFTHNALEFTRFIADNYPEYLKEVEPEVKWSDFKKTVQVKDDKVIDENGQIVPGVSVDEKESVTYKTTD